MNVSNYHAFVLVALAIVWSCLPKAGQAAGGAPASVQKLTGEADAVVAASITDGFATMTQATLSLHVERAIKGSLEPGQTVVVTWDPSAPSFAGPTEGAAVPPDTGLFFLREGVSPQTWRLVPAAHGMIPGVRGAYYPLPPSNRRSGVMGNDPAETAILMLVEAFEMGAMRPDSPRVLLNHELRLMSDSQSTQATLARLATSSSEQVRTAAISAKLAGGEKDMLELVASQSDPVSASADSALRYHFTSDDPDVIELLLSIATDSARNMEVRRSAAAALTRSRSVAALESFARLLDEDDHYLISAGVGGLSRFANNIQDGTHNIMAGEWSYRTDYTIAHATLDPRRIAENPSQYVTFWSTWWAQSRDRIVVSK